MGVLQRSAHPEEKEHKQTAELRTLMAQLKLMVRFVVMNLKRGQLVCLCAFSQACE